MSRKPADHNGATHTVRPEALEGRTETDLGRIIDEALQDLTAGAPREGFRGRVMARIAAEPGPSRARVIELLGWHVRPLRVAAIGAMAAACAIVALLIPALLRTGEPGPAETTTALSPPAGGSQPEAAPTRQDIVARHTQPAGLSVQPQPRRPTAQPAADPGQARGADDEWGSITGVRVDPLPDPDPIMNRAIEITPVEIRPLVIPEVELPPLDAGGKSRDITGRR